MFATKYGKSCGLRHMTDCPNARRLLIMWVPREFSRWKRVSWGFTLGRLWMQWTPHSDGEIRYYRG